MVKEMEPVVKGLCQSKARDLLPHCWGLFSIQSNASQTFRNSWRSGAAPKLSIASAAPDTKKPKRTSWTNKGDRSMSLMNTDAKSPLQTNRKEESTVNEKIHLPWTSGIYPWDTGWLNTGKRMDFIMLSERTNKPHPLLSQIWNSVVLVLWWGLPIWLKLA